MDKPNATHDLLVKFISGSWTTCKNEPNNGLCGHMLHFIGVANKDSRISIELMNDLWSLLIKVQILINAKILQHDTSMKIYILLYFLGSKFPGYSQSKPPSSINIKYMVIESKKMLEHRPKFKQSKLVRRNCPRIFF